MENQQTKLDKVLKISIIFGILLVAVSIAYYLIVFLPKSNNLEKNARMDCTKNIGAYTPEVKLMNYEICMASKGFSK